MTKALIALLLVPPSKLSWLVDLKVSLSSYNSCFPPPQTGSCMGGDCYQQVARQSFCLFRSVHINYNCISYLKANFLVERKQTYNFVYN
jgi:hypothetical protein